VASKTLSSASAVFASDDYSSRQIDRAVRFFFRIWPWGNTAVGTDAPVGKIVRVSRLIRFTVPDIMTHGRRHSLNPSSAAQPKGDYGKRDTHLFETNRLVV
jgi:hypothetical protein